jgi:hypothetical protein
VIARSFWLVTVLASPAAAALAQEPAPSLALPDDAPVPYYGAAVTADPVAIAFGVYGLTIELSVGRAHAFWGSLAWRTDGIDGLGLSAGYRLWFLGRGLSGLFVGPTLSGAVADGQGGRVWVGSAGAEAGFQYVFRGIVLGLAGGAAWVFAHGRSGVATGLVPVVRSMVGFAWS